MTDRFYIETQDVDRGAGRWKYLVVSVFERIESRSSKIGEYIRNYSGFYNTFHPFQQHGKWYALYSTDYTATRVMELPSCRDVAGEEPHTHGFCPVDFHVPFLHKRVAAAGHAGLFGFVAGCIWGDDSSWKIQHLDLSRISENILVREERFGYIAMPEGKSRLAECLAFDRYDPPEYPIVDITAETHFNLLSGNREAFV